jgi:glycosyltransferase involved in cell wall biosynthesis
VSGTWHLVTGEYPPDAGGVGDYTRVLARALAESGEEVHVWGAPPDAPSDRSVTLHVEGRGWSLGECRRVGEALDRFGAPRHVVVQYAPRAFGAQGANVPFCAWVRRRGRHDRVCVMFHEPYLRYDWRRPARLAVAVTHRLMASLLLRAGRIAYVSTPMWSDLLRTWAPPTTDLRWLPIPATIPRVTLERAAGLRSKATGGTAREVVIHFGTYGDLIVQLLMPAAILILERRPDATLVLLGRQGDRFRARMAEAAPHLAGRLYATGALAAEDVSAWLQAADVALQPYPDGASSRRTTLMAAVAHGLPTVTNAGVATEAVWSGAVALAESGRADLLSNAVVDLLDDRESRLALSRAAAALYESRFRVDHAVATLRANAEADASSDRSPR